LFNVEYRDKTLKEIVSREGKNRSTYQLPWSHHPLLLHGCWIHAGPSNSKYKPMHLS
jgi:hypothetical protein